MVPLVRNGHVKLLIVAYSICIASLLGPAVFAGDKATLGLSNDVQQKCLQILRDALRSDEFWPSMHAAEALTLAGHGDEIRPLLESKLETETDDQKRCGLARELVRAGDLGQASVMLKILAGDDPYGHTHAAESLYKVGLIGDGSAMRAAMEQEQNGKLRIMAAAALGRCGNREAMQLLRNELTNPDPEINYLAAWVLARIGDSSDIEPIRKLVGTAIDPLKRSYFENALAALGDAQGLQSLAKNLNASDPAVRTYAAVFAGESGAFKTSDRLMELLDDPNIDTRVRAAQSLLVLNQPASVDTSQDISITPYRADDKSPRWTEGSIVRLNDGSLLYAVTQFSGGSGDFAKARIVARRSLDGGLTWEPERTLQASTGKMNVMSVSLRRLHAPHSNRIAMFYLEKNDFDDLHVLVRYSDDEATSFGDPIRVTTNPGYHVMNNDRVTQLSSGRLLVPVASTPNVRTDNHFVSRCWISDDAGKSWRPGEGTVDQPQRGAMEPAVIELTDGRVMMIVRTQLGYIANSYSSDGGETWSKPGRLVVQAPEAPATIGRIPATGDLLLIWNNTFSPGAGHGGSRTPLTAAISSDEGESWHHIRDLEANREQTFSYTSLDFSGPRALMSYWVGEKGRYSNRFRSLPVSWFYDQH